jgi:fibrillarin-like pre-rRNA processing protein
MDIEQISPGIFLIEFGDRRVLATRNLTPGRSVYGESLMHLGENEYRSWLPYRSKMAAAILKEVKEVPITPGIRLLYLGVASGTTCSHFSDIIGEEGHIWGVEFAQRPLRDLIDKLLRYRSNISPLLADARRPVSYSSFVTKVDVIYADVAQPEQSKILVRNAEFYLKPCGWAIMAIKSRSIDSNRPPRLVYAEQVEELKGKGFKIIDLVELEPYEKDHAIVLARYRC